MTTSSASGASLASSDVSVSTAGEADVVLRLTLDAFEGPLDLLLHLIQKHELDIFDVPIAFVTAEYLRYLDAMVQLDMGIVGEYLVMAATLIQIKSAMLLPKPELEDAEEDDTDPREELIRRLLEYQKFKDAAKQLHARPQLFRETFPRPEVDDLPRPPRTVDDIEPPSLFELIDVFHALMKKKRNPVMHEVTRQELSIKDAINRIATYLQNTPRTTLSQLVEEAPHADDAHRIVITFMSVLEMAKLRLVTLFQARITGDDLIVERAVIDIAEIAMQLDFSDPESVTHDTAELDAGSEDAAVQPESDEEDEQVLADRLASLRGRPRLVRTPDLSDRAPALAEEDEALLALAALHADMDDYDVDAVLAQAFELSKTAAPRELAPLDEDALDALDASTEDGDVSDAESEATAPPSLDAGDVDDDTREAADAGDTREAAADEQALPALEEAQDFGDFVAQLDALKEEESSSQAFRDFEGEGLSSDDEPPTEDDDA